MIQVISSLHSQCLIIIKPSFICRYMCTFVHKLMRRKKERSKQGQTKNKAKQHSTPKAVTVSKKNELPRVHVLVLCCFALFV